MHHLRYLAQTKSSASWPAAIWIKNDARLRQLRRLSHHQSAERVLRELGLARLSSRTSPLPQTLLPGSTVQLGLLRLRTVPALPSRQTL